MNRNSIGTKFWIHRRNQLVKARRVEEVVRLKDETRNEEPGLIFLYTLNMRSKENRIIKEQEKKFSKNRGEISTVLFQSKWNRFMVTRGY